MQFFLEYSSFYTAKTILSFEIGENSRFVTTGFFIIQHNKRIKNDKVSYFIREVREGLSQVVTQSGIYNTFMEPPTVMKPRLGPGFLGQREDVQCLSTQFRIAVQKCCLTSFPPTAC